MNKSTNLATLWTLLDKQRGTQYFRDLNGILEVANSNNILLTLDDLRKITKHLGPSASEGICPIPIVNFCLEYISKLPIKSILDPWVNIGTLLLPISELTKAENIIGISYNKKYMEIAQKFDSQKKVQWICGNPLEAIDTLNNSFELIISCPPFNLKKEKMMISGENGRFEFTDRSEHLIIVKSCINLSNNGTAIFIVLPNFINSPSVNILEKLGFNIKAFLSVPSGIFAPLTSISTAVVIIEKKKQEKIFVGELSEDDQWNKRLIFNLKNNTEGKEIAAGKLVSFETFTNYHSLKAEERVERLAKRTGLISIPISDVVKEINLSTPEKSPSFKEQPDTVYLPLIGRSKAVNSPLEFTMKPHNYAQLVINGDKANASYIAGYFNTPLGYAIRELCYSGTFIPKITKMSLLKARLFLPDLNTQLTTIKTDLHLKNVISELHELSEQVWSRPNKLDDSIKQIQRVNKEELFIDWIDTLPFPLASILWAYYAHKDDSRLQYEYLDHFFEALAEFLATLLLSSFAKYENMFAEPREMLRRVLENNHLSIDMSTFGTWVKISEVLSKIVREMINSEKKYICKQMFCVSDEDVIQVLSSSKIVGILQETNGLRNEWRGHGGVASDQIVKNRNLILEGHLNEIRKCFGDTLMRYQLIRPSSMELEEGVFLINASRLMGNRTPFESTKLTTNEALDKKNLYLIGEEERTALKLLPLIRVQASPETAQNACYFYNRKIKDNIRFVSYHFDADTEIFETSKNIMKAIDQILTPPEHEIQKE